MAFYINDERVGGIKELCEKLGLDDKVIPFRKRDKSFEIEMERDIHGNAKRDKDGHYVTRTNVATQPVFSGFSKKLGYSVQIRYALTQYKTKDEVNYPAPGTIFLDPGEDGTASLNDELLFVFWYLHPWCGNSPFHVHGSPIMYRYKDNDAKSKMGNDHEENLINALGYIVGNHCKSVKELRSIAKGLNQVGVDDMTDETVKATLRTIAKADPIGFIDKVESREIVFSGKVQDAIDKNIITLQTLNGMVRWYMGGKEVIPVAYGQDPVTVLKEEMSSKWYLYSDEIDKAINGITIATNLAAVENDEAFADSKVHEIETKSELTTEQLAVLKKMKEDYLYDQKIKKLAGINPDDPGVHFMTLKSYNENKEAVEAYKASIAKEPVLA